MNGLGSNKSAYAIVVGIPSANAVNASEPSINHTTAACAITDVMAPASIAHSPHVSTTMASGMPNCGLIASSPNAKPANQWRCRSSASHPAQNATSRMTVT